MGEASAPGPLPTFLIVGAAKAGTTSLAAWLRDHPDVFIPPSKELHFFDRFFDRGVDWYRSQFAGAHAARAIGEATPEYMALPEAVERMAAVVPQARLIVILRDPVDRAYSQYWHQRLAGRERRDFAAVVTEQMRDARSLSHPRYYLTRGLYIGQLRHITRFFPREALLVLLLEDLRDDAVGSFRRVCDFIGADSAATPPVVGRVVNPRIAYRSRVLRRISSGLRTSGVGGAAAVIDRFNRDSPEYPPIEKQLRRRLVEWFEPATRELETWLERDLSAWMKDDSR